MFGLSNSSLPPIAIVLEASYDKLKTAFNGAGKEMDKLEAKGASFGQKYGAGLKVGFAAAGTAVFSIAGVALKEAMEAETVMLDLQNNIKAMGQSMADIGPQVDALGERMISLGFDDEAATKAFITLNTATKDSAASMQLVGLAADLARKKGIPLEDAARSLAMATTGSARAFREFGVTMDTSIKDPTERVNVAMKELQSRIGGSAEAFAETGAGSMEVFKQSANNVMQELGTALLPTFKIIIGALQVFAKWAQKNSDVLSKVLVGAIAVVTAGFVGMAIANLAATWEIWATIAAIAALIVIVGYLWNNFEWFRDAMMNLYIKPILNGIDHLQTVYGNWIQFYIAGFDKMLGAASALASFFGEDKLAAKLDAYGNKLREYSDEIEQFQKNNSKTLDQWEKDIEDFRIEFDFEKFKKDAMKGLDELGEFAGLEGKGVGDVTAGDQLSRIAKLIQKMEVYAKRFDLLKSKVEGNLPAMQELSDAAQKQAAKWLRQAEAYEKATKGTAKHEEAVKRLKTAITLATEAQKYQNDVAKEAENQAAATARALNAMTDSYARANSYLAAQSRVSGFAERSTFIEVPVVIDGQVLFRVQQKASLINNRRNQTNGLARSNQVI